MSGLDTAELSFLNARRGGEYDKRDCETKAFPRLAAELKACFPRLRMCLLADSLHAVKPFFDVCPRMKWNYIVVFKKGRTPAREVADGVNPAQIQIRFDTS